MDDYYDYLTSAEHYGDKPAVIHHAPTHAEQLVEVEMHHPGAATGTRFRGNVSDEDADDMFALDDYDHGTGTEGRGVGQQTEVGVLRGHALP